MTAKEKLSAIKAFFVGEPAQPATPVVPAEQAAAPTAAPITLASKSYKLKDGGEISVSQAGESPAVGDTVMVNGIAQGGTYVLEDGTTINADSQGIITAIVEPEPVTADLTDQPPAPTLEQRISNLENLVNQLKTPPAPPTGFATETALAEAKQQITKHETTINDLFELVEKLVQEPSSDPVTLTGNKKEQFDRSKERHEKILRMSEARRKNKVLT